MMSAYLEKEFSANVSDFLVIMLNLCAYKENERGKGREEGKEKKRRREEKERGRRDRM